jgi:hypothetical protein
VSCAAIVQNFSSLSNAAAKGPIEHQAFDTVRQVAESVAGRMPLHAVNPDAATRLARLRKA